MPGLGFFFCLIIQKFILTFYFPRLVQIGSWFSTSHGRPHPFRHVQEQQAVKEDQEGVETPILDGSLPRRQIVLSLGSAPRLLPEARNQESGPFYICDEIPTVALEIDASLCSG